MAARTVSVTWAAADPSGSGIASTDVRYGRRSSTSTSAFVWTGWRNATTARTSTLTSTALASTYCFQARARDVAGNLGPWSSTRCITTPTDDRTLTTSGGWQRGRRAGYIANSFSATSKAGASLATPTSVAVHRIGLVAMHCPNCGSVTVYVGAHRVGIFTLKQSSTGIGVFQLPAFISTKFGIVKYIAAGKLVLIDGVLISS